jgi:hypothetical protein
MAAIVAPTPSHGFPPHRSDFITFHQHFHRRGPVASHHNPFKAFSPHHHSGPNSRSAVASWRQCEPFVRTPIPAGTPSPKYRRSGSSHSRLPPAVNTNWRSQMHSPSRTSDSKPSFFLYCDLFLTAIKASLERQSEVSSPFVYTIAELLRLSASPLVGINKESQAVVDDLVAHHVWRRGPRSRPPRAGDSRRSRDNSKSRSLHTSSDDSEHSD